MCGINGFYSKSLKNSNEIINKMNLALSSRGPDAKGIWKDIDAGIVFGHRRLSIIDLTVAGNQPMQSKSNRFVLTYNGEIYNHLTIRKLIEKSNPKIVWRSRSDTETLLEAINSWGIEIALNRIEGMFAFGLWDKKTRCLTLARDRIGEKPLYFGWQGKGSNKVFIFSSEIKALKIHPQFDYTINRDAIALQLRHNCIPAPYSIYKHIHKLSAGSYIQLKESDLNRGLIPKSNCYWSLVKCAEFGNNNLIKSSDIDIENELENKIKASIGKQMISDVPIGAFLSGGIDSSLIVSLMQSLSLNPVKTFTIGFSNNDISEAKYAKNIAQHLGTDHTELYISAQNALEVIPKLTDIYDEPFSDSSQISTLLVSKLAKQQVKVTLSGDGGDELFCGYNRYVLGKKFSKIKKLMPHQIFKIISFSLRLITPKNWTKISKFLPLINNTPNFGDKVYKALDVIEEKTIYDFYYNLCSHWKNPSEVVINAKEPGTLLNKFKPNLEGFNDQQQMMILDTLTYLTDDILVKIDRASMASSLETRLPFLDHKLIEYAWKIPQSLKLKHGNGKWILRQILNKHVPKNFTNRPKMGFAVPIDDWLRGSLRDWAENLLNEERLKREGYLNPKPIRDKWNEHLLGKNNWQHDLWDVLMFQSWLEGHKKEYV